MNTKTFRTLEIGDCFYFTDINDNRLSGPHIKTKENWYLPVSRVLRIPFIQSIHVQRVLHGHEEALVEVLPFIGVR